MTKRPKADKDPILSAGVVLLVLCLAVGIGAGLALPAARTGDGLAELTNYMVITTSGGAFNWFLMLGFTAVGILCFAMGAIGSALADRLDRD